jgi:hypothetical protein
MTSFKKTCKKTQQKDMEKTWKKLDVIPNEMSDLACAKIALCARAILPAPLVPSG